MKEEERSVVWQPTKQQVFWAIGIVIALLYTGVLFWWLWGVLAGYIQPKTPTDKKDLVNIFVVIGAGVVGTLTAVAAVGNLFVSRRNLQNAQASLENAQDSLRQQRDLLQQQADNDERHARDEALQAYYNEIGDLLTDHNLIETERNDPLRILARAHTLTLLVRLSSEGHIWTRQTGELIRFLYAAGLISKNNTIVDLASADFSGAGLDGADLSGADFSHVKLSGSTFFKDTNLADVDFSGADLSGALFVDADLSGADLSGATVTEDQLAWCESLKGATMPDGQNYEEWLGTPEGQNWLRTYKKDLGEDKQRKGVYEEWIRTAEGKMWLKAGGEDGENSGPP